VGGEDRALAVAHAQDLHSFDRADEADAVAGKRHQVVDAATRSVRAVKCGIATSRFARSGCRAGNRGLLPRKGDGDQQVCGVSGSVRA
jgi:hypothetical protein